MVAHNKDYFLSTLKAYYDEGTAVLEEDRDERKRNRAVWNMEFLNKVPDDTIYYPTARLYGMYVQRSIVSTYTSTVDIANISPRRKHATEGEAKIADSQNDIFNERIKEWEGEREKFLDDTSIQGVVDGSPIARIYWEREVIMEPVFEEVEIMDEETGLPSFERVQTGERERILSNRPRFEYVATEDFIHDSAAVTTDNFRWAMHINIKKTKSELLAMADTLGFNRVELNKFLDRETNKESVGSEQTTDDIVNRAEDNEPYVICEFWGQATLSEDDESTTFVRAITDQDFSFELLPPKSKEDDQDEDTPDYLYYWLNGKEMIPYRKGYLSPIEGAADGISLMAMARPLQGEENGIRNGIRRFAEKALNTILAVKRGSGIDTTAMKDSVAGRIVWTNDPIKDAIGQFRMSDQTPVAFNDLAATEPFWQMLFGGNRINMGVVEPGSLPETAFATNLISSSGNKTMFGFIERYNNSFLEPLLYMMLVLSLQFTTDEEIVAYGIELPEGNKDFLLQEVRLTIDTGIGATSDIAKETQYTKQFFLLQQKNQYLVQAGFVPPAKDLLGPVKVLEKMSPLNGFKDIDTYFSSDEEIIQATEQWQKQQQQANQQAVAQAEAAAAEGAREAGETFVMDKLAEQQQEAQKQAQKQEG
jgi:hypothetical protein